MIDTSLVDYLMTVLVALGLWILNKTWAEIKLLRTTQSELSHEIRQELTIISADVSVAQRDIHHFNNTLNGMRQDMDSIQRQLSHMPRREADHTGGPHGPRPLG